MAATIHLEYIEGRPGGNYDEKGWLQIERAVRISGVPGTGTQLLKNSVSPRLSVTGNRLPQVGDEHPELANMRLIRYEPRIIGKNEVDVTLVYERQNEFPSISVGSTIGTVEVKRGPDGKLFTVEFNGKEQGGTIAIPSNLMFITVKRRERGDPIDKADKYVGNYNNAAWKIGNRIIPGGARTWKCTEYSGESTDGINFDVVISFERAPQIVTSTWGRETYDKEYYYKDPETGEVPGAVSATGGETAHPLAVKTWSANPTSDFNEIVGHIDFDGSDSD